MVAFLEVPDGSGRRNLRRVRVIDTIGDGCIVVSFEGPPPVTGTQQVHFYYELHGRFVRQIARAKIDRPGLIDVELTGAPVPAERRHQTRVSYLDVYDKFVRDLIPA